MTRIALLLVMAALLDGATFVPGTPAHPAAALAESPGQVRFGAVDVFVDAGSTPLAAYQFELRITAGNVTLVGVEGGEHRAFRAPPYYDPKALSQQRIIVAAFDTGSDLPRGQTRVARLMVQIRGPVAPAYHATLVVAASAEAIAIPASLSVADAPVTEGENR